MLQLPNLKTLVQKLLVMRDDPLKLFSLEKYHGCLSVNFRKFFWGATIIIMLCGLN